MMMRAIPLMVALLAAIVPALNNSTALGRGKNKRTYPTTQSTLQRGDDTASTRAPSATKSSNRADPRLRQIGFTSRRSLDEHWRKHGAEFGNPTLEEYLAMAQDLRDAPLSKRVIEAPQSNGSIARFDRQSGAFMAFNDDLTIRTYFRPNGGESYFQRAINRK
jgi:hypothetical protein